MVVYIKQCRNFSVLFGVIIFKERRIRERLLAYSS